MHTLPRLLFLLLVPLLALGPATSQAAHPPRLPHGTILLTGSMASSATLTMTGAFSVGNGYNLDWDLPHLQGITTNGYTESLHLQTQFSVPPTSHRDLVVNGLPVTRYHWDSPPTQSVLTVTQTLHLAVSVDLTPFHSTASYPLAALPAETTPYLHQTTLLSLTPSQVALAHQLATGKHSERAVVSAVADYVAAHTHYDYARSAGPFAASWVLTHHATTCRGYDNELAALLHVLGIPTRTEFGWVSSQPLHLPGPAGDATSLQWSQPGTPGELHTWLDIFFPDAGWVSFDPQNEKFFVDDRHLALLQTQDAGMPSLGTWQADFDDGQSATGAPLPNGDIEILPGFSDGSQVSLHLAQDRSHLAFRSLDHDVSSLVLFAR